MIYSLQLENFRKHSKLDLNFTAGMNGIFGPNYTGKTTILYGVLFCLGGITAVPCKSVIKSGCTTFTASMTFGIEGKTYKVLRTKSTDKLFKVDPDGTEGMIANGAKVVNKHIEQLIGMSMARFCQIRYSRQKFTSALLTLGATELHNILSDVSGADFVQQVLLRLADMKKKLEWETDGKELVDIAALETEFQEVTKEMVTAAAALELSESVYIIQKEELGRAIEKSRRLAAERAQWTSYLTAKQVREEAVERCTIRAKTADDALGAVGFVKARKPMPELVAEAAEQAEVIKVVREFSNREEVLRDRLARSTEKEEAAKEALVKAKKAKVGAPINKKSKEETYLEKAIVEIDEQTVRFQVEIHELAEKLKTGVCKSCNRPLDLDFNVDEGLDRLESLKAAFESHLAQGKEIKKELDDLLLPRVRAEKELEAIRRSLESAEVAYRAANENMLDDQQELNSHLTSGVPSGDLPSLELQLESMRAEITALQKDLDRHQRLTTDAEQAIAELESAQERLAALEDCKEVTAEMVDKANQDADEQQRITQEAATEVSNCTSTKRDLNARFRTVEFNLSTGKVTNAEIEKRVVRLSAIKGLQKFLQENKDEYMREVWASLMADATQLVMACTEGDIEALERTEDGKFAYTEDGQQYNVSEASGAQAAIMGLAVQTALARALPPVLDVLLVDEPTADMDDERSMVFSMLLPTRAAQVICISHARMDSSTCQNIIDLGV
jgi:DNA repair exonuclease SbcCD ATPase subunit